MPQKDVVSYCHSLIVHISYVFAYLFILVRKWAYSWFWWKKYYVIWTMSSSFARGFPVVRDWITLLTSPSPPSPRPFRNSRSPQGKFGAQSVTVHERLQRHDIAQSSPHYHADWHQCHAHSMLPLRRGFPFRPHTMTLMSTRIERSQCNSYATALQMPWILQVRRSCCYCAFAIMSVRRIWKCDNRKFLSGCRPVHVITGYNVHYTASVRTSGDA